MKISQFNIRDIYCMPSKPGTVTLKTFSKEKYTLTTRDAV